MKRISTIGVILLLTALTLPAAKAQYADYYYHRVGDTIEQTPNNGYFAWWRWDDAISDNAVVGIGLGTSFAIILARYTTAEPMRIVGLAGSPTSVGNQPHTVLQNYDVCHRQEYFYLYDAGPAGDTMLARVPWDLRDTGRYLHIHSNGYGPGTDNMNNDSCCGYSPWQRTIKIWEYYFDSAITVTDSFYVGGSTFSGSGSVNSHALGDTTVTNYNNACWISSGGCKGMWSCFDDTVLHKVYPSAGVSTLDTVTWSQGWRFLPLEAMVMVYPIIEVDTTLPPPELCPELTGFRVQPMSQHCLAVTWNDYPNYSEVQVAHGPIDVPQSDWTVSIASGGIYNICSIDTSMGHYGVKLRSVCYAAHDTTEWTQPVWVDTRQMHDAGTLQTVVDMVTHIGPNPASDRLTVTSQMPLSRVELYNARGVLVLSQSLPTMGGDVDLSPLPDGLYIAVVRTLRGTTARRILKTSPAR